MRGSETLRASRNLDEGIATTLYRFSKFLRQKAADAVSRYFGQRTIIAIYQSKLNKGIDNESLPGIQSPSQSGQSVVDLICLCRPFFYNVSVKIIDFFVNETPPP